MKIPLPILIGATAMVVAGAAYAKEDISPFARVVSWDPERMDGCRANRIQEFHPEDVFLESEVARENDGSYEVPAPSDELGCLGLQWIERRMLTELTLRHAEGGVFSEPEAIALQAWSGESQWQGQWHDLGHELQVSDGVLTYSIDWKGMPNREHGTSKVRWLFPKSSLAPRIAEFGAYTASEWETTSLTLQAQCPSSEQTARISVYNGRILASDGSPYQALWEMPHPMTFAIRYARPDGSKADRTVLSLQTPSGSFGIAVDDILERGPVSVKHLGIEVCISGPTSVGPKQSERLTESLTVLQRVREMPDQVFPTAFEHVHNPVQNNGPTMISLACDNRKFTVEQDGTVHFTPPAEEDEEVAFESLTHAHRVVPRFGKGQVERRERRLYGGWLPVPVSLFTCDGVIYGQRAFVTPFGDAVPGAPWLSDKALGVVEFTIESPDSDHADIFLELSFHGSGDEGSGCDLARSGDRVLISSDRMLSAVVDLSVSDGLDSTIESNRLTLSGSVSPGQSIGLRVYVPTWRMYPEQHSELTGGEELLNSVRDYWETVMRSAAKIETPDEFLNSIILASQIHCLIAARNEGAGARIAPWIASVSYGPLESEANSIIRAMAFLGHDEFAKRSLDYFVKRYNEEGFLTTGYTMMGTGWHLWTLGEYYRLTRNKRWLRSVAPKVSRVCNWIIRQTEKTKGFDLSGEMVPEYGLMPPGVQADWNAFAYHFSLNGYYYAGLESASRALADIGFPGSDKLLEASKDFRTDIIRAYEWTQSRSPVYRLRDGSWVPAYPGQLFCPGPTDQFFPGEDGNRSWCYDVELGAHQMVAQGVLEPDSREVAWMMNHMEDVQFLRDGMGDYPAERSEQDWLNLGGFAKVQPYYCRNTEIYAMQDDVKPFIRSYFNTIGSLLNTENLSFWEHFHNIGAWNKTHETGYFLHHTRLMLAMERGRQLWIAPFVTSNWMKDGMRVALRNAPTFFGKVSYEIVSHAGEGFIEAYVECPADEPPSAVVIRLRHPDGKKMKAVTVNGEPHADFDPARECVYLKPLPRKITVKAKY